MTTSQGVVLPLAAIEAVIGRAFAIRADAQQRAKGVERIEAAIKAEGLASFPAMRALESAMLADPFKVCSASSVGREKLLEFPKRLGEREIVSLMNVESFRGVFHEGNTSTGICGCKPDRHALMFGLGVLV